MPVAIVVGLLTVPTSAQAADPIPVTVRVTGAQTYGGLPAFAGSTGVAGLTVTGVTCTGLTSGVAISPTLKALGSYAIAGATCSGGTLSNPGYTIAGYTGGAYAVYRAPLKVTAQNRTKVFGAPNPALGYAITGYVNGQDSSVVAGEPALSTTATASSDAGTYPITVTAGTLAVPSNNYYLTYAAGTLTVSPKPVAVTVGGVQNYGGQPVFSAKTSVAGVTVSEVVCTGALTGQTIAPTLPAGSYAVDPATCSGGVLSSTNYAIGSYKSASFLVFKAPLTVTATDASRVYGFANPTLDYTLTGFQNDEDASDIGGTPTLSTPAVVKSDAGTYPIEIAVGSLSSPNYRFVLLPGTLTVTKRQLTVRADPATRAYGAEPPAYTASYTGFRNGDTAAVLAGGPAFSTPATATSDPGTYPLDVGQGTLDSPNYSFGGFVSSTLTITPGVADIATTKLAGGVLSATVTFGTSRTPVVGSTITFTIGNGDKPACTAVTDATGRAACSVSGSTKLAIQLNGYTANFPGTAALLPGKMHQGIL
ncbi:MBG-2 domain-containing protein [Nocardioides pelophilus]|uniref:MBG-2 domain-containing protein n=1 Tax=Nocardioides pelophilus TaxID=2172019 RepID=UPI001604105C|nr:MBG-2 domain-containing protein [Nocardioides pelophilus]